MISKEHIIIRGLRQNNLKNVSLDIPKGKMVDRFCFRGAMKLCFCLEPGQEMP